MGFHQRTEFNKFILKIGNDTQIVNPKGGFVRYGLIKNDYVLVKGSVVGSEKRTIVMVKPQRPNIKKKLVYELKLVSIESKQ